MMSVLGLLLTSFSDAACVYTRTAYNLISCQALPETGVTEPVISTQTISSMTVSSSDLPGLEEAPVGPSIQIVCGCDYTLKGADPLCETDRVQEFTSTEGSPDPVHACRPGKSLCATRCPKQIP